ncbi:MAG: sigma-70 family RNA polymerase sigma factor [Gemmatimonadota bacterium]
MDPHRLLETHLPIVDRIVASICRRRAVLGDDADDFSGWVRLRLLENDGAILRRFEGRTTIGGYLTVVIWNLYRDYRIAERGKWRPSAEARRRGPVAIQLDALLHRDGFSLREAAQALRARFEIPLSDTEFARLAAALPPRRDRPEFVDLSQGLTPDENTPEKALEQRSRIALSERTRAALDRALRSLPREDEVIIRMHYLEGHTLADVSRTLGLPQKPLYRRVIRTMKGLERALTEDGVDVEQVKETLHA